MLVNTCALRDEYGFLGNIRDEGGKAFYHEVQGAKFSLGALNPRTPDHQRTTAPKVREMSFCFARVSLNLTGVVNLRMRVTVLDRR